MAEAFSSTVIINRPRDEVWAVLTDWEQAPNWMKHVESMRAEGPPAEGTQLWFRARGKERPSLIAALTDGEALTLRSSQGGVTADYHYRLDRIDDSTTSLELRSECTTSGPWTLLGPVLRRIMAHTDGGQPAALKQLMEQV